MRNKLLLFACLLSFLFLQSHRSLPGAPDCTAYVASVTNNTSTATVNYVNIIGCTQNSMNILGLPPMTSALLNQPFGCATLTVKVAMAGPFSFIGVYLFGSTTPSATANYIPGGKQIYTLAVPYCGYVRIQVY
jgi:hypothetical protein